MKEIKFKTSKGEFLVVDGKINLDTWDYKYPLVFISKLSEITEEGASKIVDELWNGYKNYNSDGMVGNYNRLVKNTAIESLRSLLKSKGITELNNKYIFKINGN